MTPRRNQVAALAAAIERVARLDVPADNALSAFFREHPEMGVRDRAWVSDGAFAYLRRKRSYEALAEDATPRHLALAVAVREFRHSVRELEDAINGSDAQIEIQYPQPTMKPAKSPYAALVYAYGPPVAGIRFASRANVSPRHIAPMPMTIQKMIPRSPYGATAGGER